MLKSPIFIDTTDTIYFKSMDVIRSVSIGEYTKYYVHRLRAISDDFVVTDDGVLFSLEKVVREGSESSLVNKETC